MDRGEARRVLGVAADATPTEIRSAFRRLVRSHHPDQSGEASGVDTVRIIAAYRLLERMPTRRDVPKSASARPGPVAAEAAAPQSRTKRDVRRRHDRVWVDLPPARAWPQLLEAAHDLGEVAYVDRSAALIEVVITFTEHPVCSVVLSVQAGRGGTEASVGVEALSGDVPPPADAVASLVAHALATHVGS